MDHRAPAIPARWWLVTAGLLATSLLANRLAPAAHLAIGLVLAPALAVSAGIAGLSPAELGLSPRRWRAGLGPAELGLSPRRWRAGLRWGAVPVAVLTTGYAAALAVGPAREALAGTTERGWPAVALATLVVIPLGTVLPEELAFRGVLWALLCRRQGEWAATAGSSVLFGLWHVLPALGGGPANELVVGAVGGGAAGTAIRVAGTVLLTGVAGVGFCWLRTRSGSLLAPALLHWAVNALGLLAVQLA